MVTSGKGQLGSIPVPPAMPVNLASNNKSREAQQALIAPSASRTASDQQESLTTDGSLSAPALVNSTHEEQDRVTEGPEDEREARAAGQQVMRHEDSGIRMPMSDNIVELPPLYTPG